MVTSQSNVRTYFVGPACRDAGTRIPTRDTRALRILTKEGRMQGTRYACPARLVTDNDFEGSRIRFKIDPSRILDHDYDAE